MNDAQVIHVVTKGARPDRPLHMIPSTTFDLLWHLVEACWSQSARQRMAMSAVKKRMVALVDTARNEGLEVSVHPPERLIP